MGDPNCAAISAGFLNTPEPIMLPAITEVAAQKPIFILEEELADILGRKITKNLIPR
jgi:hypothetical protein